MTGNDEPAAGIEGGEIDADRGLAPGDREAVISGQPQPERVPQARLAELAGDAIVRIEGLEAGYGDSRVLHGFDMQVGRGQSVCLVGPNGAGKSTVLNAMHGLCQVHAGSIEVAGADVTHVPPHDRLRVAHIAYLLQDNSVFPDMSVEENLLLGGHLFRRARESRDAAEAVFARYPSLADRRRQPARVLSGGERRLLEISRALIMDPAMLLVDEPSIGLDARAAALVFDALRDLQQREGRTIIMVEQNVRLGLGFADIGYVLVAGRAVHAAPGAELLRDGALQRHFHKA